MDLQCTHCNRVIEYSREAPRFCSYCGGELSDTGTGGRSDETHTYHVQFTDNESDLPSFIGGYRLLHELGRGGMGVVFEAEQESTGRRVAIKLLSMNVRRTDATVRRFMQEGELAASLSHPRSTFVYAAGEEEGQFFIVMELMSGGTLKDLVQQEERLPVERAVDFTLDVMEGLEAAHATGVIHRDVKPSNCFLDQQGRAKVGDYGLSKSLVSNAALTQTGAFMGTPQFAAPEQIRGGQIDEGTDVYAVGATLFCLITGEPPFQGDAARVIAGIASDEAPRVRSLVPDAPKQLDRVIAQTLEKDPARRPGNLAQLRQSLVPFSSRGASIADLGRRMAAFFIDMVLIGIAVFLLNLLIALVALIAGLPIRDLGTFASPTIQLAVFLSTTILTVGYFAVGEGWWGCGVGKRMMGLRVVGLRGESPAFIAVVVRAAIIPGLMLLFQPLIPMLAGSPKTPDWANPTPSELIIAIFVPNLYLAAGWLVTSVCLVTMRRRNGYRGVHEFASWTRVVRAQGAGELDRLASVPVTVPEHVESHRFGSFEVVGKLSDNKSVGVYTATDAALARPVWILERNANAIPMTPQRVAVSRPTRPFWLASDQEASRRWDAFEAVHGCPLEGLLGRSSKLSWQQVRGLLLELSDELTASLADGTLPPSLDLAQVWLDRTGRIKLLDFPVTPMVDQGHEFSGAAQTPTGPLPAPQDLRQDNLADEPETKAMRVVRALLELCSRHQLLPGHAMDFVAQLAERPDTRETLDWTNGELRRMLERPSTLGWDDRLGVVAVSFCTEMTVYSTFTLVSSLLISLAFGESWLVPIIIAAGASLTLPMLMGYILHGGPVFHLTGIQVRQTDGRLASRLRCGWRSLIAWLPTTIGHLAFGAMLAALSSTGQRESLDPMDSIRVMSLLLSLMGTSLVHGLGALYAVVRPRRGIQDLVAGTRLVPS